MTWAVSWASATLEIESAGVDLYRAPVDNERARTRSPLEARWKRIGLDHARRRLVEISRPADGADAGRPQPDRAWTVRRWAPTSPNAGAATPRASDVDVTVTPSAFWPGDLPLPRIGWTFALPSAPDQVEYEGFGPHEAYPDTGGGTTFGRWSSTLERLPGAVRVPAGER